MKYKLPKQPKSQILFHEKQQAKDFIRNTLAVMVVREKKRFPDWTLWLSLIRQKKSIS